MNVNPLIDLFSSTAASSFRSWNGTAASRTIEQPEQTLILFDREGCPECRFVREALTELNLNIMIAPCPKGGRNIRKLKKESGSDKLPRLVDPNTDKHFSGRKTIIDYLFSTYRGAPAPKRYEDNFLNNLTSSIASAVRLNAGSTSRKAKPAELPLTLYSFESSPFSRPVRELLCELELPYLLINLGKQQRSDMGPAKLRFTLKPYRPLPNSKRDAFFKQHGNVQVPYLVDPNTGIEMFESADILDYLRKQYGT